MPFFQSNLLIQFDVYGWSELFYQNVGDATTALTNLNNLATLRAALLDPTITVTPRVSQVDVRGDSFYGATLSGTLASLAGTLNPSVCVEITKLTAAGRRGILYFRGIPPGACTNQFFTPPSGYLTAFTTYRNAVIAGFLERNVLPNPTPPPDKLVSYQAIVSMSYNTRTKTRRVGRPFFLPRGRRRVS